jgi:hypothetical protein
MSSQFQSYSQVNYSNDISRNPPDKKEVNNETKNKNVDHKIKDKKKQVKHNKCCII